MGGLSWTSIKLAIFTAVTVVVTVWIATLIGNFQLFAEPYEITAQFTDATGLLKGDVVKAAGVTVGRVESIELEDGLALVTMSIEEGNELPADLNAEVRFRNLIGQRMVTLVQGHTGAAGLLEAGDTIPLAQTEAAFDLTELFNGLRPLIRSTDPEDINTVTRALVTALKGRGGQIESLLTNISDISDVVASRDSQLTTLLRNLNVVTEDIAGRDQQLQSTVADLNTFLGELQANKDELAAALVSLDAAAGRLGRLVDSNDAAIADEIDDLATLLDAVDDKRADLRGAVRALPEMLVGVERVNSYGQWSMIHLIDACKDDLGICGRRGTP
nr:MCE family protein [Actinomycetota bacterium]